ncbi:hydantoinase B/oxoprolinase family protein [Fodinicurvata sp. EGI_FJ10296]|uniref:hydantoinase B/oxoprolinase family protein n=1 Tax=Fodinicurvata sp. EGI_FJ10296 TaxID=3231908 RepID=UPI003456E823
MTDKLDAVSTGIMWDRLIAITDEIQTAIVRSAFSVGVREAWDLACIIFDAEGRSIAQATLSMPAFIGTAPLTMAHMLARFPAETLAPGDVLATNDPWLGTGHTPDICVARPVFRDGRVVAFVMTITHLPDIGGAGLNIANPDLHHEGIILPICKLYEAGRPDALVHDLVRLNVRSVDEVMGDIEANVVGTDVGARLIGEFMDDYALDDLAPLADAIIGQSEAALRARLSAIPDGRYDGAVRLEGVDDDVDIVCSVTIEGDRATVDFEGTGPMVASAINVPFCYTRSFTTYALKCLLIPGIPNNQGAIRPITVTAPEGCILNARKPAPTGGRHTVGWFIVPAIFGALAPVLGDAVQADAGMASLMLVTAASPSGRDVVTQYFLAGGLGAMCGKDGQTAVPFPTNNAVVATEIFERETGIRVLYRRLIPDTGGIGRWRGGLGQEARLCNHGPGTATIDIFGLRTRFPARGFDGGGNGARRVFLVNDVPIPPKGRFRLATGDTLTIREAGGGGFGDPHQRDPAAVAEDIAWGRVSTEAALRDYGVRVDPETGTTHRQD